MDAFMSDIFDIPRFVVTHVADVHGPIPFVHEHELQLGRALASPALAANLAFHEAWLAMFGVRATRLDYAEFVARVPLSASALEAVRALSSGHGSESFLKAAACAALESAAGAVAHALPAVAIEGTPLHMAPASHKKLLLDRGADAYRRTLGSIAGDTSGCATRRLLLAKLRDRFAAPQCSDDDGDRIADAFCAGSGCWAGHLVQLYADLLRGDDTLPELESWAGGRGQQQQHPEGVTEYYSRAAAAAELVGLPWRCPLTGAYCAPPTKGKSGENLSCVELLRWSIMHDGSLWRKDMNGTLLLVDALGCGGGKGERFAAALTRPDFVFRTLHAPARICILSLPTMLYSVVVIACPDSARSMSFVSQPSAMGGTSFVLLGGGGGGGGRSNSERSIFLPQLAWLAPRAPAGAAAIGARGALWLPMCSSAFGSLSQAPRTDGQVGAEAGAVGAGAEAEAAWASPLRARVLSDFVANSLRLAAQSAGSWSDPTQQQQPAHVDGVLLHQQFVVRYAAARLLGSRVFATCTGVGTAAAAAAAGKLQYARRKTLLVVDSRRNVMTVVSLLITLDNLRCEEWDVVVLCAEQNLAWTRACVLAHVPNARVEPMAELTDHQLDQEGYSRLLKRSSFWRAVAAPTGATVGGGGDGCGDAIDQYDRRVVLLVQDDGMLVRRGLDDDTELLGQAYAGAPWRADLTPGYGETLAAAGVAAPALVGNGGLSLRSLALMVDACERDGSAARDALFHRNMQPVPEDVFFSAAASRRGMGCPRNVAARLSFEEEQPAPPPAPPPLGFHKPWPYVPRAALVAFLDAALAEAAARAD